VGQTPEDVADTVICLATVDHVTGQAISVNGECSLFWSGRITGGHSQDKVAIVINYRQEVKNYG
jgi:hypothetical protein